MALPTYARELRGAFQLRIMAIRIESYPKLLSLAVHELRTPASVVGGYLRMLQREQRRRLSERQRKMVEEAEKSCARIVALVAELSEVGQDWTTGLITMAPKPLTSFRSWSRKWPDSMHEAGERERASGGSGRDGTCGAGRRGPPAQRISSDFQSNSCGKMPGSCTVVADRRLVSKRGSGASAVVVVAEAAGA